MRIVDKVPAWLSCLFGLAHLVAGHAAFVQPTERRIWFASAEFLLLVAGFANLAAQSQATRLNSLAGAVGGASILVIGALLAFADPALLAQPQTLFLLAVGAVLTIRRSWELVIGTAKQSISLSGPAHEAFEHGSRR